MFSALPFLCVHNEDCAPGRHWLGHGFYSRREGGGDKPAGGGGGGEGAEPHTGIQTRSIVRASSQIEEHLRPHTIADLQQMICKPKYLPISTARCKWPAAGRTLSHSAAAAAAFIKNETLCWGISRASGCWQNRLSNSITPQGLSQVHLWTSSHERSSCALASMQQLVNTGLVDWRTTQGVLEMQIWRSSESYVHASKQQLAAEVSLCFTFHREEAWFF